MSLSVLCLAFVRGKKLILRCRGLGNTRRGSGFESSVGDRWGVDGTFVEWEGSSLSDAESRSGVESRSGLELRPRVESHFVEESCSEVGWHCSSTCSLSVTQAKSASRDASQAEC
jgi:hypothetical protein